MSPSRANLFYLGQKALLLEPRKSHSAFVFSQSQRTSPTQKAHPEAGPSQTASETVVVPVPLSGCTVARWRPRDKHRERNPPLHTLSRSSTHVSTQSLLRKAAGTAVRSHVPCPSRPTGAPASSEPAARKRDIAWAGLAEPEFPILWVEKQTNRR